VVSDFPSQKTSRCSKRRAGLSAIFQISDLRQLLAATESLPLNDSKRNPPQIILDQLFMPMHSIHFAENR
jgi:hypothetical protein